MAEEVKGGAGAKAETARARDGTPPGRPRRTAERPAQEKTAAGPKEKAGQKPEETGAAKEAPPEGRGRRTRTWIGVLILLVVTGAAAYGLYPFIAEKVAEREAEAPPPREAVPEAPAEREVARPAPEAAAPEAAPSLDKLLAENAALQSQLAEASARLRDLEQKWAERPEAPEEAAPRAGLAATPRPGPADWEAGLAQVDRRLSEIEGRIGATRTPEELAALRAELSASRDAVAALSVRLADLETDLQRERARSAGHLELFLAVQQLREAMRVGAPFAAEYSLMAAAAKGDKEVLALIEPLDADAQGGIATLALLQGRFAAVANRIVSASLAPEGAGWVDQTLEKLSAIVSVRRTGAELEGDTAEAVAARAEAKLDAGDLAGAVAELEGLSGKPAAAAAPWLAEARKRLAADAALDALDRLLVGRLSDALAGSRAP